MLNPRFSSGAATSSELTEYRKNRMIYANFVIQQQNVTNGCIATMGLETPGGVAPGSIIPVLKTGALYTTPVERDLILGTSACDPTPVPTATLLFTTVGTTSWTVPAKVYSVQYLIVGGGGGSGGGYDNGGGGGGGGGMVLLGTLSVVPGTSYTITVGDGGIGGISNRLVLPETNANPGDTSTFGPLSALGGGGGYGSRQPSGGNDGRGGLAALPPSTASLGGRGWGGGGGGGGGGGSSGAGTSNTGVTAGTGGTGTTSSLSGSSVTYGVGGTGANGNANTVAVAGTANTGNGARAGGGATGADEDGAKGGSGLVLLKY